LKETLSNVDSGVFNKIFNADSLGLNEDSTRGDSEADSPPPTTSEEQPSQHAADAVDYSDFTETVPDDPMFTNDRHYERGMGALKKTGSQLRRTSDDYDEDYDLEEQDVIVKNEEDVLSSQVFLNGSAASTGNDGFAMPAMPTVSTRKGAPSFPSQRKIEPVQRIVVPPPPPRQLSVQELYPGFEKGKILKFSELLGANRIHRPPKLHVKGKKGT
jgi:transcription initiation factor TFIID subunit 1, fungi type